MFTLTFGIYGGMVVFAILVFLLELAIGSIGKKSKQPSAKEGSITSNLSQQTIEIITEDCDENEDIHAIEKVEEETNQA